MTNIDGQPKWESVDSLGDVVLFLGTNSTFYSLASFLPNGCKGNCIVFSEPRSELASVRSHDIYVADIFVKEISLQHTQSDSLPSIAHTTHQQLPSIAHTAHQQLKSKGISLQHTQSDSLPSIAHTTHQQLPSIAHTAKVKRQT
jgi:hypothetical protein